MFSFLYTTGGCGRGMFSTRECTCFSACFGRITSPFMPTLSGGNIIRVGVDATETALPSLAARERMLGVRGEPLLYADWLRVVFVHFEVEAGVLQRAVPFELDLFEGRAFVSLVAFTMRGMRPRIGGKLGAWLFK